MDSLKPISFVDESLETALAAHQKAVNADNSDLAHLRLRFVVMAQTPIRGDVQRLFDYLSSLAVDAWPSDRGHPEDIRHATLVGIRQSLKWQKAD